MKKIRDQKRELAKAGKRWQKDGKMANLAIQSLAYFFILLGGLLMVVAVILPFWKEPDYEVKYKSWALFGQFSRPNFLAEKIQFFEILVAKF